MDTATYEQLKRKVPVLLADFRLTVLRKAQACRKKVGPAEMAKVVAKMDVAKEIYMTTKKAVRTERKAREKAARLKAREAAKGIAPAQKAAPKAAPVFKAED